jgi:hypothetical protein
MASILNVDQINNAAGTSAITIDANGNTLMPGHVVQVVEGSRNGTFTTTSTSFTPNGLSVTITPESSTSKILLSVNCMIDTYSAQQAPWTIFRSINGATATNLFNSSEGLGAQQDTYRAMLGACAVDSSHGTTLAITYSLYCRSSLGGTIEFPPFSAMTQYLIAQEIAQ